MPPQKTLSEQELEIIKALQLNGGNKSKTAREGGWTRNQVRWAADKHHAIESRGFEVEEMPQDDIPDIQEILKRKEADFEQREKADKSSELVTINIKTPGAICLAHMGDPHLDDRGCNIKLLKEHIKVIRNTPGMFPCNVGDYTNNWVGNLMRKYADQTDTAQIGIRLIEWYFSELKFLYLVGGNHDVWHTDTGGDPAKFIARQQGHLYQNHGVRMRLVFPNGRECFINARHDFPGHSMWNPLHGLMKEGYTGHRDDLYVAGHIHQGAVSEIPHPDGRIATFIRVNSYKHFDEYPKKRNMKPKYISPCISTIIDPDDEDPAGFITVHKSIHKAAEHLKCLRKK